MIHRVLTFDVEAVDEHQMQLAFEIAYNSLAVFGPTVGAMREDKS